MLDYEASSKQLLYHLDLIKHAHVTREVFYLRPQKNLRMQNMQQESDIAGGFKTQSLVEFSIHNLWRHGFQKSKQLLASAENQNAYHDILLHDL